MKTKFYRSGNLIAETYVTQRPVTVRLMFTEGMNWDAAMLLRFLRESLYSADFPLRRWKRLKLSVEAILILKTENIILSA